LIRAKKVRKIFAKLGRRGLKIIWGDNKMGTGKEGGHRRNETEQEVSVIEKKKREPPTVKA